MAACGCGFAPRGGAGLGSSADGNSAVRAGVGFFYTPIPHRLFSDVLRLDGRHGQRLVVDRPGFFPGVPDALPGAQDVTATIRTQSPDLTLPMMLVSTVSYDRRLVGSLFGSIGYTWRRGTDLLRTRNIGVSPEAAHHGPECPEPAVRVDGAFERSRSQRHRERQYRPGSDGVRQLRVYAGDAGHRRSLQCPRRLSQSRGRVGRCTRAAHRVSFGGSINLPDDFAIYPFVTWTSALPFNITSGNDTNLDSVFTDRPSLARRRTGRCGCDAVRRLQSQPAAGRGGHPAELRHRPDATSRSTSPAPRRSPLYNGLTPSSHRTTVLLSVSNLLNHTNYAPFNGVLTSPFFGTANRALNKRRVTLSARYDF